MENNATRSAKASIALPEGVKRRLAVHAIANDDGVARIVAASTLGWAELASLSDGEAVLGEDGLIRLALWSASNCCAALVGTRRATLLLPEGEGLWEMRCLVLAKARLATPRPQSGFLLRPVALHDRRAPGRLGRTNGSGDDAPSRADEARQALFDVFPVDDDGEIRPVRGGAFP